MLRFSIFEISELFRPYFTLLYGNESKKLTLRRVNFTQSDTSSISNIYFLEIKIFKKARKASYISDDVYLTFFYFIFAAPIFVYFDNVYRKKIIPTTSHINAKNSNRKIIQNY